MINPTRRYGAIARLALPLGVALAAALAAGGVQAASILFIGNSFTFAALSPVRHYKAETVTDLNGEGTGGVPALFKAFTREAGLDYTVSLETSPGKNFDWHYANKRAAIARRWDAVVMQGFSTLDGQKPGDPTNMIKYATLVAADLRAQNPDVAIYYDATWSRADMTYQPTGHWYGKPIEAMAKDIRAGYDQAKAATPGAKAVLPVGDAWNRAFANGFADPNPYDGISFGKVDLWAYDNYHASSYGYYLEALVIFGGITGRDPRSLGEREACADDLGISPAQTKALQQTAYETLAAEPGWTAKPAN